MANVFRADHIGPLVKPESLLHAHRQFAAGITDESARRTAEDAAIVDALELQKAAVMTVVTDGEFRRAHPDEPYVAALEGLSLVEKVPLRARYVASGPIRRVARIVEAEADFLGRSNQAAFKICLASPGALAVRLFRPGITDRIYPTVGSLAETLAEILRSEIEALLRAGVPYVQLNAPVYHALFEGAGSAMLDQPAAEIRTLFDELLAIDAAILKEIETGAAIVALRVGRVAQLDDASDRYERMVERLVGALPVNRMLLEYGEPQEHDFQALRAVPDGMTIVLGLVRTEGEPEEIGTIMERIDRAARTTEGAKLSLSPRRGFANTPGSSVRALLDAQRGSLIRTSEVVQQYWGLEL